LPSTEWFFPGKDCNQPIQKHNLDKKFKQLWNMTPFAETCDKAPTIHALSYPNLNKIQTFFKNA
jgi:hypothetical protein